MSARDDLSALIEPLLPGAGGAFEYGWDSPAAWAGEIADAVLAAGWREPPATGDTCEAQLPWRGTTQYCDKPLPHVGHHAKPPSPSPHLYWTDEDTAVCCGGVPRWTHWHS